MSDTSLEPVDGDLPVNPYSLLEAVNSASNISRSGWVLYLALMSYLLVAVAGVTHKELLLNAPIPLPILQVDIALARFFAFAPLVLLFTHFGMLIQHVMLARKVIAFDESLQPLENTKKPTHPLRLELHSYFFTQALAGPQRSWLFGFFLQAMIWMSLVILPVFLILYIQVIFLPYHSEQVTWGHRLVLLLDVALLFFIGIFLRRADASFFTALWRVLRYYPLSFIATSAIFIAVIMFSFFVATVPYGFMDRMSGSLPQADQQSTLSSRTDQRRYFGYSIPFLYGSTERTRAALFGLFHRNLIAKDLNLVSDKDLTPGEPSITLRGRNLRDAVLDRTDLQQADLSGADLRNASLVKTDLRGASLTCIDIDRLRLGFDRKGAECARLRGANLSGANLQKSDLQGADFTGAKFENTNLADSDARRSIFTSAVLFNANLQYVNLTMGVDLMGANFLGAHMQGVRLTGARLQGAELSGADLQGAALDYAYLQGVNFVGAELQGANLSSAILYGADMSEANLTGADLSKAQVWMTHPPSSNGIDLIDMSNIRFSSPKDSDIAKLEQHINAMENTEKRAEILTTIDPLLKKEQREAWGNSDHITEWRTLAVNRSRSSTIDDEATGKPYVQRLTGYLNKLMCSSFSGNSALANGIVQRANSASFNGDARSIRIRLDSPDCPGSKSIDKELLRLLSNKVRNGE